MWSMGSARSGRVSTIQRFRRMSCAACLRPTLSCSRGTRCLAIPDGTMDFGYSLGVFHALPDPPSGIKACVDKLKPNAPFLLYTYYALDNRPAWYRGIWTASDLIRRGLSRLPYRARLAAASALAVGVYWPLA